MPARLIAGDPTFDPLFAPVARWLVANCDCRVRIGGSSAGADHIVAPGARAMEKRCTLRFRTFARDLAANANADLIRDARMHRIPGR